jgi:hypothetical protein
VAYLSAIRLKCFIITEDKHMYKLATRTDSVVQLWFLRVVRAITATVCFLSAATVNAGSITNGNYIGTVQGIGIGFFSNVGVGLTGGATCNGQSVVVLLTSNPQYTAMLAALLSAQASGQDVKLFAITGTTQTFAGGNTYCVITAVSFGDFPLW